MAIPQEINECDNESTERLNCPDNSDENGDVQRGDNENQNHEAVEGCVLKKFYYVSFVVNGIFLGLVLCFWFFTLSGGMTTTRMTLNLRNQRTFPPRTRSSPVCRASPWSGLLMPTQWSYSWEVPPCCAVNW